MNYQHIYNALIQKRIEHKITRKDGYCEKHHIIPKSLGGTNAIDNLVNLTPKEHYLAHLLLCRIVCEKYGIESIEALKMTRALICMTNYIQYGKNKNSKTYSKAKKDFAKSVSWFISNMVPHSKMSKERKEQNRIDSSRRKWVCNKELNESHFAKPEDLPWYFKHGFILGRFRMPNRKIRHPHVYTAKERKIRSLRRAQLNKIHRPILGKIAVNNGSIQRYVKPNEIPDGFIIGGLPKRKK